MRVRKIAVLAAAAISVACASATPATAVTVGQVWPGSGPHSLCGATDDFVPGAGAPYAVPAGYSTITSWSTNAGPNTVGTQSLTMKIFRPLGANTYFVVARDGPRVLAPSTLNTFTVNIPVQPGDLVGLHTQTMAGDPVCAFQDGADAYFDNPSSNISDGATGSLPFTNLGRLNVSAEVAPTPSNDFTFVLFRRVLIVSVSAPGRVDVNQASGRGATADKRKHHRLVLLPSSASGGPGPGTIDVPLLLTRRAKHTLKHKHKVTIPATITFTPHGGLANTKIAKLKVKTGKKRKR